MAVPTLVIRPIESADLEAVVALESRTYETPWSARIWEDELATDSRSYLLAEVDGTLVGYAGIMVIGDDAHVTTVVSSGDASRVGTRLMLELVRLAVAEGAGHLTLEVRTSNTRAQELYRRFGMAPVGVRKNYYRGEDALIMWAHDIGGDDYQDRVREIEESLR